MTDQLLVLFLVVSGAAVVPFLARRLRFPAAALEILFGVALFHTVCREQPEWFLLLKEIGFVYLMFIAGMELDLRGLARSPQALWYAAVPVLSLLSAPPLFGALGYSLYAGLAVAMISAGIVIPVLRECELLHTSIGRDIAGAALVGELLSILVLTATDTYQIHGLSLRSGLLILKLAALFGLAALALRVIYVIAWWRMDHVEKVMQSQDPTEEGIRLVILLAFGGALMAHAEGLEPILGSFLAGLVTTHVFRNKGPFEDKINAVGFGFLTPFFFIGVGAGLDVSILRSFPAAVFSLFLGAMVFATKLFPVALARLLGLSVREALGMSLLLSAPLSMMVVAGALGLRMGLLTPEHNAALVFAALLASVVYPYFFRRLAPGFSRSPGTQRSGPHAGG